MGCCILARFYVVISSRQAEQSEITDKMQIILRREACSFGCRDENRDYNLGTATHSLGTPPNVPAAVRYAFTYPWQPIKRVSIETKNDQYRIYCRARYRAAWRYFQVPCLRKFRGSRGLSLHPLPQFLLLPLPSPTGGRRISASVHQ
jgi:hypothetical protein